MRVQLIKNGKKVTAFGTTIPTAPFYELRKSLLRYSLGVYKVRR